MLDEGLQRFPSSVELWLMLGQLEEWLNNLERAKDAYESGLKHCPNCIPLRHMNKKEADVLMAKALLECPNSGILWAASIEMASRPRRKSKSADVHKNCSHDPHVLAAVAKLFWQDRKVDKARTWLNKAVTLAPDIGDFWACYYKFELQHGDDDKQRDMLKRCLAAKPKNREKWQAIAKAVENSH
ncbi:hypothetical protein MLD38_025857 [Melastoma candidum]|uniref:Uncharacterized protein n=1 Tax=Melastoma candidum TaxID=119954 RepID=A0ACB9NZJ7_9MYRT|nr:hypothetical protein MLD38_025857 [Melastoma candidum]